jgi:twinkle protein
MKQNNSKIVELHQPCPVCTSSDAYCQYEDGHGHCYSCNYHKFVNEDFLQELYTYEYLPLRGLSRHTLEFYDIKTKVDKDGQPISIGFKYPDGRYKVRSLTEKSFRWEPAGDTDRTGLFGRDHFSAGKDRSVIITEGEFDAASLYQATGTSVVSVQSASSAARDVAHDRSWVDSHERIYLAFDNDAAGREALKSVARMFDYNKILVVNFDRFKDANECLQAAGDHELRLIWQNARRYLPDTVVEVNADNIDELLGEAPKPGVPYPWVTLNEKTYGIRRGESVLITAQEGVGKTALMHAIEYQLLRETTDAIGAIYLEEDKREHLHQLAGIHLQKPAHLPDAGIAKAEIKQAIQDCTQSDGRLHLYNHFGSDDPDVLLDTIRFMVTARNVVFVLLDHIGISVSGLRGERDERRALDYLSTRLAMMIKELNFALIMVSHVNDDGKTRGSRLIGKDCHVRIDVTRDVEHESDELHLMVSKNRPIGRSGPAGVLLFDQYTRQMTEISNGRPANDNEKAFNFPKAA